MPLPPKKVELTYRGTHLIRDIPEKLEGWMTDNGYVLRLLSKDDGMASILSPEHCYPLVKDDLPKDAKVRRALITDLRQRQFLEQSDGTFQRGDVRLFVQSRSARDQMRVIRKEERARQESVEAVYEQVSDMNQRLVDDSVGGVTPGFVTADPSVVSGTKTAPQVAPVGAHASGGANEVARSMSLMDRIEQAGEAGG